MFYVRVFFNNFVFKEINILKVIFFKKNGLKYKISELGWIFGLLVYFFYEFKFEIVSCVLGRCEDNFLILGFIYSYEGKKIRFRVRSF